jgi:hypothetical protein
LDFHSKSIIANSLTSNFLKVKLFMKKYLLIFTLALSFWVSAINLQAQYLFAQMTKEDYGHLYYSVSKDGLKWEQLNGGKRVHEGYRGHPDIMQGNDGRYYMIGVEENTGEIPLWVSTDLLDWKEELRLDKTVFDGTQTTDYKDNPSWYGAPKLFYDGDSKQYIITWHAHKADIPREKFAEYWCSMRTFYVLTKDFKTFTKPKRLIEYEMGTIDVIIRKENGFYYAFLKDECEATAQWPTGKSIRVAVSRNLTGPYSYPSGMISPSYHEAPSVVAKPDGTGWYMYYEMYTGQRYSMSEAPTMAGPWFHVSQLRYALPDNARHGCMFKITSAQYDAILKRFGNK